MLARDRRQLTWGMCLCLCVAGLTLGCGRGMTSKRPPIHPVQDLDSQQKYKAQSSNEFFYNGMTMQAPVPGTIALGELQTDDVLATGKDAEGNFVPTSPLEPTPDLIARGAFTIHSNRMICKRRCPPRLISVPT